MFVKEIYGLKEADREFYANICLTYENPTYARLHVALIKFSVDTEAKKF